jgi:hypothetical protein
MLGSAIGETHESEAPTAEYLRRAAESTRRYDTTEDERRFAIAARKDSAKLAEAPRGAHGYRRTELSRQPTSQLRGPDRECGSMCVRNMQVS